MKYIIFAIALVTISCSQAQKKDKTEKAQGEAATEAKAEGKETKAAATAQVGDITCKIDGVTRTLRVVQKDESRAVEYTKDGNTEEIATCSLVSEHCANVVARVRGNLENAGWTCE